jgi:hypothetical protein
VPKLRSRRGLRFDLALAALTLGLAGLPAAPARAWSPAVHQRMAEEAIDTLPKGLKPFYKNHRLEMPSLALDQPPPADDPPERRFIVDRLKPFPFLDLPQTEADLKKTFGDQAATVGRLPWLIRETYARLVEAFKAGDKVRILTESDALAGLVADVHNPLALSDNFDGQKTEQHGFWVRFTVRFPEVMGKNLKLSPEAARLLDDPGAHVFAMIKGSYVWLDNLLYQEEIAKRGQSGYSGRYYQALEARAAPLLKNRLEDAATDIGSYWYSAWTAAGRPELK